MKTNITRNQTFSIATLAKANSKVATAHISMDFHTKGTVRLEAIQYLYQSFLLSGTKSKSREKFLDELNKLGSRISIGVQDGVITFTIKSLTEKYKQTLSLFEEMYLTPAFSSKELVRIKKVVKNELQEAEENSRGIALTLFRQSAYKKGDRHYAYLPREIAKELESLSVQDFKQFHKLIQREYTYATITGTNDTIARTVSLIENIAPRKCVKPTRFAKQQEVSPNVLSHSIPAKQNIDFAIGAPLPLSLRDKDYPALHFGIMVLAKWGGFSGRLMSTVREKEGLTYAIYGRQEGLYRTEHGYWRIWTFFSPEKSIQGLSSTFKQVRLAYEKGITPDELRRFKNIIKTKQALVTDSIFSLASELHSFHMQDFSLDEITSFKESLTKVTKKQVDNAIKKYLEPSTLTIAAAGPINSVKKDITAFHKKIR